MNNKIKIQNKVIVSLCIVISIFLISNNFIPFSKAQINSETFSISSNFSLSEYSKIEGIEENASSLKIELPEPNWTLTNMQINFSDIQLGNEIKAIEDSPVGTSGIIWNKNSAQRNFALGMQIEILELTELFGVLIRGSKTVQATTIIKFQINGFDKINKRPNATIYRSIDLNISTDVDWYYQDFSSDPITLAIGNYTLVMNGTNIPVNIEARYFWQIDDIDPKNPFLHTSSYITSWSSGTVNSSHLCKLKQKTYKLYFPTALNMTAQINGDEYEVMNGPTVGTGFLEVSNSSYFLENTNLEIPLVINESITMNFNYTYSINLANEFITIGSANIREINNRWSVYPIIDPISTNYHVKLNFPKNWFNLSLYRKLGPSWENVTSLADINVNTSTLIVPSDIILDGYEWKINANSPNIIFNINLPELVWERGHELQFSVNVPIIDGNLTFYFINSLGFGYDEPIEIKKVLSAETIFSYLIPLNARGGTYTIIIYWNNDTDGGVQFQEFKVNVPFILEPIWIVVSVVSTIALATAGILSYRTIKKFRTRREEEAEKLYNKCMDVFNLDYIIISNKKSGLNFYQQKFSEKDIDAAMISGFLQAIHSFGIELIKIEDRSQTIKLEYKDSIIIMTEFVNLRLILIMKEHPSLNFLYSLEDLAYDIYKYYGELIDQFTGDIKPFKSIEKLFKQHLNTSLTYPIQIAKIEKLNKIRIGLSERALINKAIHLMKKNNADSFRLRSLLLEEECSPKDIEITLDLIKKNIFQVIE